MADDLWEIAWLLPEDALQYWQERIPITKSEWDQLESLHRTRAFTVAGVTSIRFLSSIYAAVEAAMEEGLTLQEFVGRVTEVGTTGGFLGQTPHHLHTVFFNNLTNSYMAGRLRQMRHPRIAERRPVWIYDAVNDKNTRPSHHTLDNTARRFDDPFWQTYYPPNGHLCRCDVITATAEEAAQLGLTIGQGIPEGALPPDAGWEFDPVTSFEQWKPDLSALPAPLRAAYEARHQAAD